MKNREEDFNMDLAMALSLSEQGPEEQPQQKSTSEDVSKERELLVSSMPNKLRQSLKLLADDQVVNGEVLSDALASEEDLVAARSLSIGAHFDNKIQSIVSQLGLRRVRGVPKVNDSSALSKSDDEQEFEAAKTRLEKRLESYMLAEYSIAGDGNCMFRSLSDQLYRTPKMHAIVRSLVVKHLKENPETYSRFVPGDYEEYCKEMEKIGVWGDHLTLQTAADKYGIQINLITSYKDSPIVEIMPRERQSSRILWLSFFGELHYNSLYTYEDIVHRRKMDKNDCVLF